jgi:hypothetical protein
VAGIINPFGEAEKKEKGKPFRHKDQPKLVPICPFTSMSIPVPAAVAGGEPTAMCLPVGCFGEGCACWSEKRKGCGMPAET